jgi:hypothetical protein
VWVKQICLTFLVTIRYIHVSPGASPFLLYVYVYKVLLFRNEVINQLLNQFDKRSSKKVVDIIMTILFYNHVNLESIITYRKIGNKDRLGESTRHDQN